ncbi:hypothetical protein CVT26_008831 [Gymnopilus dilepis]|uniref:F-box domain-containing protein n=1 Tax=Gymnopilus dilepis TaxID=231916 RepID=A0A409WP81_9AGAR|nr:hypothetical protein CVT26_008831 [Gymnopilus dilepis]
MATITTTTPPLQKLVLSGRTLPTADMHPDWMSLFFTAFIVDFITSLEIRHVNNVPLELYRSCHRLTELIVHDSDPETTSGRSYVGFEPTNPRPRPGLLLEDIQLEQEIINIANSSLQELSFRIYPDVWLGPHDGPLTDVDLGNASQLRIFETFLLFSYFEEGENPVQMISNVLASVPNNNHLERLNITCYAGWWTDPTLDNFLKNPCWSQFAF